MPWVGLDPTIPAYERSKTFHGLRLRAATVIGCFCMYIYSYTKLKKPEMEKIYSQRTGVQICSLKLKRLFMNTDKNCIRKKANQIQLNYKFWKELTAYFPFIRHVPPRKRQIKSFVAAETCLPSRCLPTIRVYTDRHTDTTLIRHGPHRKRQSNNASFVAYILYSGNVFKRPQLPCTRGEWKSS
jgi:hypothetical protein